MKAIEQDMFTTFGYNSQTTLDASMAALGRFLAPVDTETSNGRTGDSQQFASALALISRLRGLPSRVVVGYRVTQ